MQELDNERVSLSTEQLDDLLKQWKRKGAERVLTAAYIASIPLAVVAGFFGSESVDRWVVGCAVYYCGIALGALVTLP